MVILGEIIFITALLAIIRLFCNFWDTKAFLLRDVCSDEYEWRWTISVDELTAD